MDEKEAVSQPSLLEVADPAIHDVTEISLPILQPQEQDALRKMMNVTFRTATGLSRDIGMPRNQIGEVLNSLVEKGLVERTISPNTLGPRWKITRSGVRVLNSLERAAQGTR